VHANGICTNSAVKVKNNGGYPDENVSPVYVVSAFSDLLQFQFLPLATALRERLPAGLFHLHKIHGSFVLKMLGGGGTHNNIRLITL